MNMELEFHVVKQSIKRTDGNAPVSDSVNYLTAEFNFDSSDWDNTTKTATFRNNGRVYTVILDASNKCTVPWEIISNGKMKVSVYGDGANDYRITADAVEVSILASGFSEGEESQQPTPTQYEQLASAIATKSTVVVNPSDEATGTANKLEVDGTTYNLPNYVLTAQDKADIADLVLAEIPEVEANPALSGTEADLESIQIGDTKYKIPEGGSGTNVVANPTLAGTESDLTGLQVGDTKYKVPSGGSGDGDNFVTDMGLFSTFAVVGDSFASGNIGSDNAKMQWGKILGHRYGITYLHLSKGGLSTRTWLTDSNGLSKMQSSDPQDLYIFALGINDAKISGYIGSLTDITSHDNPSDYPDTFYGNYGKIIEACRAKSVGCRMIMTTVAPDLSAINTAIRAIAEHYGMPLIDIVNDSFFSNSSYWYTSFYGGHPTAIGYSGMAKRYAYLIAKCIDDNKTYFRDLYKVLLYSISATKTETTIQLNGSVDTSDITVTAKMTNNTTKNVTSSAVIDTSDVDTSVEGIYPIHISYTEGGITKTTDINVTVADISQRELVSISASVTNTTVTQDTTYTPQGLSVIATYNDTTTANVTSGASVGTIDTSTTGNKSLPISYTEGGITKTTNITIEVVAPVEPTTIMDASFAKNITGYNNFGAVTIHDNKGYTSQAYAKVDFDATADGKPLYYKLTGSGIETGCGNYSTTIGSTTILNNYTMALANDWTPLLDKNGNQVYAESGKTFTTAFGSASNSGATFPINLNVRFYLGYA